MYKIQHIQHKQHALDDDDSFTLQYWSFSRELTLLCITSNHSPFFLFWFLFFSTFVVYNLRTCVLCIESLYNITFYVNRFFFFILIACAWIDCVRMVE